MKPQKIDLSNTNVFKEVQKKIMENDKEYYFVHKWSRKVLKYTNKELLLPKTIYVYGQKKLDFSRKFIGIGGTRSPSANAFIDAFNISYELSKAGMVLISGGVVGIDLASHMASVDTYNINFSACVVLANPVESMFGSNGWNSHRLSSEILNRGCFLSEYKNEVEINSNFFKERLLQRDRIISGLSNVFIAFECSENSATVDTAKRAFIQGKKVFAVQTRNGNNQKKGVEQLIEEGWAVYLDGNEEAKNIVKKILTDC